MKGLKYLGIAAILAGAGAFTMAAPAPAGAMSPLGNELPSASSEVIQVGGCHRNWQRGLRGNLHRHVGRDCRRVNAREYRSRPRDWGRRNCVKVGPVWLCD